MRTMPTIFWNTKFSYAVIIAPQMLIGKVKAMLNTISNIITLILYISSSSIVLENILSVSKYKISPAANATIPITT